MQRIKQELPPPHLTAGFKSHQLEIVRVCVLKLHERMWARHGKWVLVWAEKEKSGAAPLRWGRWGRVQTSQHPVLVNLTGRTIHEWASAGSLQTVGELFLSPSCLAPLSLSLPSLPSPLMPLLPLSLSLALPLVSFHLLSPSCRLLW